MRHFRLLLLALVLVALLARPADADHVQHGLRVPDGFEITEFADNKLANDIFAMTIDPKGRVVVSGPGYIRLLLDDKGEGKATRTVDVANPPEGAQGLLWEGDSLYYMAQGGLRRYTIKDDKGYGTSTLLRAMKTGGEHASHAIKRGPDGWLYVLVGNNAGLDKTFPTTASSPIKEPVAGGVMRFSPDFKTCEVVVDGYRNAYDMDFNLDGELFTFDSDNERCVGLPWYEPVRFYHVLPGEHYGWLSPQRGNFWRLPAYDADTVTPLATFGRGSPTGVVCYRHLQFPEAYRGGIFLADWTFGRIYFTKLKPAGATYSCEKQTFLEAVGDEGFAPTALAVHPQTGDLYISIGGRGTRGAVYRIRYTKGGTAFPAGDLAKMQMAHRSLDWQDGLATELPKQARSDNAFERRRALEELRRQNEHFKPAVLKEAVLANGHHADRYVRFAAAELLAVLDAESQHEVGKQAKTAWQDLTYGQAVFATAPADALERATKRLADKELPAEARLTAVRVIQLALGDLAERKYFNTIWEGYTPRKGDLDARLVTVALPILRSAFPSGHNDLDREISRTLAVVQDDAPETLTKVADRLTDGSLALEDIHYLTVLGRLRASRPAAVTERVAGALLALDQKVTRDHLGRDTNWPLRIGELHTELAVKDTKLNAALIAHASFGRPDHALFAQGAGFDQKRAAEIFLEKATKDQEYAWNGTLVTLIGALPADKALPPLRKLWGQAGLDESILPVLGRYAEVGDRDRFLSGLNSPSAATVRVCVEALEKLPASPATEENLLALVQAMRRLGTTNDEKQLEERIAKFLRKLTGKDDVALDRKAWVDWFAKTYPKLAPRLNGPDGVDVAAWTKRLARVDWTAGDVPRGQALFTKVGCAACHSGAQALGPDLKGVAGRFSRDDLLTAIIQPSKDISARYRTTVLETADGRVYQGLIIYEAPDSVLLQTGPAKTVRVVNTQVASRRTSDLSLMPAGLLDPLKEEEIADLLAYLKSLGTPEPAKK
jgi:putative heme-binding domain-containing protein